MWLISGKVALESSWKGWSISLLLESNHVNETTHLCGCVVLYVEKQIMNLCKQESFFGTKIQQKYTKNTFMGENICFFTVVKQLFVFGMTMYSCLGLRVYHICKNPMNILLFLTSLFTISFPWLANEEPYIIAALAIGSVNKLSTAALPCKSFVGPAML